MCVPAMLPLPHHNHPVFQTAFRLSENEAKRVSAKLKRHTQKKTRHAQPHHRHFHHRARPADLGQYLSGHHRISAAKPPVHRRAYPRVAGRTVAAGMDAQAASARRMGHCRPARFFEHRLFPSHVVCGGVSPAGQLGGGAQFHADADGAGVHLVNRQNCKVARVLS